GFLVVLAELALADRAVVALQLLLRHELGAEVGRLLAALAVLARAVSALVQRRLGAAPEIDAETAVDLVLRILALRHEASLLFLLAADLGSCLIVPVGPLKAGGARRHGFTPTFPESAPGL